MSTVWIPPTEPRVLSLESQGGFPLRSLLCSESAAECGTETRGWVARANRAFREQHDREDESRRRESTDPETQYNRSEHIARCGESTADLPRQARYAAWYDCVHALHPVYSLLPRGRFRAPVRGWFIIRGRRGHYAFCDEIRAYDLATGAAHFISRCSRRIYGRSGLPDGEHTRTEEVFSGRVPLDNLREAALLTFLAPQVQQNMVPEAVNITDVPPDLERVWDPSAEGLGYSGMGLSGWFSSGQTSLHWSYILDGRERAQGSLIWPVAAHEGQNHAASLLATAERGLVRGCAPANIPPNLPLRADRVGLPGMGALWRTLLRHRSEPCRSQSGNR